MRLPSLALVLLISVASSGVPMRTRAESAVLRCTPGPVLFDPPAGDVPANWPAFRHMADLGEYREWGGVRLVRVSDGTVVPAATSRYHLGGLAPREELIPGEDYDLYQPHCYGEPERVTRYHAVAAIAEPASLGTIEVSPVYAANFARGAMNRIYFVDVLLQPNAGFAAEPWASSSWNAAVDGVAPSIGGNGLTYRSTRVLVSCGSGEGVGPGDHMIRGVAYPIFDALRFSTPAVPVSITAEACDTALRVELTTSRPLTPDEIAYWDEPDMDASVPTDCGPSMDGGRLCTSTERDTNSNCSITTGHRGGLPAWAMLLVAVVATARARRRERRMNASTQSARRRFTE